MLIWLPSASPPVLYTAVGVYIKFYICRPLLHQPLPSTRGLQRVYSSTAVYRVYRYTGIQRSTVYTLLLQRYTIDQSPSGSALIAPVALTHAPVCVRAGARQVTSLLHTPFLTRIYVRYSLSESRTSLGSQLSHTHPANILVTCISGSGMAYPALAQTSLSDRRVEPSVCSGARG